MFSVKIDKKAEKNYRKMPEHYQRRIFELGQVFKLKPVPAQEYGVTKIEGMDNTYRIRIGTICIVYNVSWNTQIIEIFKIEWRGKAYK